jgi:hypothetical protein
MDAKAFVSSSTPTSTANGHAASHDHSSSAQEKADVLRLGELKDLKGAWKPQVLLIDAGAEWECYSADVTRKPSSSPTSCLVLSCLLFSSLLGE